MTQALHHHGAGRLAEAQAACVAALRTDPSNFAATNLLGVLLFQRGDLNGAATAFTAALRGRPDAHDVLLNLGVVQQALGRAGAAAGTLRRLIALQPTHVGAYSRLGVVMQLVGDIDGATVPARRAVRLQPHSAQEHGNAAVLQLAAGSLPAAVGLLRNTLALDPADAGVYRLLGTSRFNLGTPSEAEVEFRRSLQLDPGHPDAGHALVRSARYSRAAAARHDAGAVPGLVVRGHFSGVSGYAHMTNRYVAQLLARRVPLDLIGLFGGETWENGPVPPPVRARAALHFLVPPAVEPVPGLPTVLFSMFEGTRIPPAWGRLCQRFETVIVPAESSRVAWVDAGYPADRLRVCPLGVDAQMPDGPSLTFAARDGRRVTDYRRRFLNVSDFLPRKNVDGLLRVWLTSTQAADDAVLVLKLGKGNPKTRAGIEELFAQTEAAVGRRREQAAPIVVLDQAFDEEGMTALFRMATHYVSLSHGEGWDLPMSKAGAMGLQLVAPRNSAYLEYLDDEVAHMIPCAVGPAHLPYSTDPWPPFHGLDWWEPDEQAAAAVIRSILDGCDGPPKDARTRLLQRFTWSQATERLLAVLRDAGAL
ncbi:tetratricopeptide repeat protein [Azospirillum sp.]|uniref:tetratricopeptide repeat protein n=1 Tax=Azospirillum sp. TaxID=34012 RepID=UPI003D72777C